MFFFLFQDDRQQFGQGLVVGRALLRHEVRQLVLGSQPLVGLEETVAPLLLVMCSMLQITLVSRGVVVVAVLQSDVGQVSQLKADEA